MVAHLFAVLALLILPLEFSVPMPLLGITYRPWRLFALIMALMLALGAVMIFFLEESPKFLVNKGDTDKAMQILKKYYGVKQNDESLVSIVKIFILQMGYNRRLAT